MLSAQTAAVVWCTMVATLHTLMLLLALTCSVISQEQYPSVYVTEGRVKGRVDFSRNERKFVSFLGIPYAKPVPRFQAPEPAEPWEGLRDCTYFRDICPQFSEGHDGGILGSEDCLYLNVFMPTFQKPSRKLLPVMVFFGDENFQSSGAAGKYGPEYFMDQDVILVTLSYRLGALGFLTTEDDEIASNLGLKDQVMALKWIQANVHIFGGDRQRVTLFGSGTGSIAVSLHMLSPLSTDLFAGIISQSGTFACANAIVFQARAVAFDLGAELGCHQNSSKQLAVCLGSKNVSEIITAQENVTGWSKGKLVTPFGPTVEPESEAHVQRLPGTFNLNHFLPDYPENLVKLGRYRKVPWIAGVNSKAGYSDFVAILKYNASYVELLRKNWTQLAPLLFHCSTTAMSPATVAEKVLEFYFLNQNLSSDNINELYSALSDKHFYCVKSSLKMYAKYAPVFPYYFTYQRVNYMRLPEVNGVSHMEELHYLFTVAGADGVRQTISRRSRSFQFSSHLTRLWVSFAEHGVPTDTWPKKEDWCSIDSSNQHSKIKWYRIDDDCSCISEPFSPRMEFWEQQNTDWKLRLAQNESWQRRQLEEQKYVESLTIPNSGTNVYLCTASHLIAVVLCSLGLLAKCNS